MRKINNMSDLVSDLTELYSQLRDGKVSINEAKEINNTAGKIINGTKVQLEYQVVKEKIQKIAFLEQDNSVK